MAWLGFFIPPQSLTLNKPGNSESPYHQCLENQYRFDNRDDRVSQEDRVQFYLDTFGIKQNDELKNENNRLGLTTRGQNTLDKLLEIEAHPTNNHNGNGGTAFAAFNTASFYVDHEWTYDRKGEKSNDKRVESAIIGTGSRMKAKAWESLVGEYL